MIECKKCSHSNPEEDRFCSSCGNRIDGKKLCPYCNQTVDENVKFCGKCGGEFAVEKPKEIKEENRDQAKEKPTTLKKAYYPKLIKNITITMISFLMFVMSFMPVIKFKIHEDIAVNISPIKMIEATIYSYANINKLDYDVVRDEINEVLLDNVNSSTLQKFHYGSKLSKSEINEINKAFNKVNYMKLVLAQVNKGTDVIMMTMYSLLSLAMIIISCIFCIFNMVSLFKNLKPGKIQEKMKGSYHGLILMFLLAVCMGVLLGVNGVTSFLGEGIIAIIVLSVLGLTGLIAYNIIFNKHKYPIKKLIANGVAGCMAIAMLFSVCSGSLKVRYNYMDNGREKYVDYTVTQIESFKDLGRVDGTTVESNIEYILGNLYRYDQETQRLFISANGSPAKYLTGISILASILTFTLILTIVVLSFLMFYSCYKKVFNNDFEKGKTRGLIIAQLILSLLVFGFSIVLIFAINAAVSGLAVKAGVSAAIIIFNFLLIGNLVQFSILNRKNIKGKKEITLDKEAVIQ